MIRIEFLSVTALLLSAAACMAQAPASESRPRHGFHTLPDGTMTPLHVILALIVARDSTTYATTLYPFTLLRAKLEPSPHSRTKRLETLHDTPPDHLARFSCAGV